MIELLPMSQDEFQEYYAQAVERYGREQVRAGNWQPASASIKAELVFHNLLPDGLGSEDQHLRMISDPERGKKVGVVWYSIDKEGTWPSLFICDLMIYHDFRRQGYGTQVLQALEGMACQLGAVSIALHVFGHNLPARALYEKLGYRPTNIRMTKDLGGS
jgi:ribosomal protein S18 acetylase RimI-like enzyme